MFDIESLKKIIESYKNNIKSRKEELKYKFNAVSNFQSKWNIDSNDFPNMLKESLSQAVDLLNTQRTYPYAAICNLVDYSQEKVKGMYIKLYDENESVYKRIKEFKNSIEQLAKEKNGNKSLNHFQNEHIITTYLWLRYPEKYYSFRFEKIRIFSNLIKSNYEFKTGQYENNINNYISLYSEVNSEILKDEELKQLINSLNIDSEYKDPELHAILMDIVYYASDLKNVNNLTKEYHKDYSPNISKEKWIELLNNSSIFGKSSLEIMKRLLDFGGEATCSQLADKYGEEANFYNSGSTALAKRVKDATNCNVAKDEKGKEVYWPILYRGMDASASEKGVFKWILRDELKEALKEIDLSSVELYKNKKDSENGNMNYWFLNAKPKVWRLSSLQVGETQEYTLYNSDGNKRRVFQNFIDAKKGDIVIGYESTPSKKIVAILSVSREQNKKSIEFKKEEALVSPIDYSTFSECEELKNMEYLRSPQGSLFKLTKDEYSYLMELIRDENPKEEKKYGKYTASNFEEEVYFAKEKYNRIKSVLENKKNIILQGAPGVGKTFAAKRLAYSIIGEKDENRVKIVQFHQNYSYEDFVAGYKPEDNGFKLKTGIFYDFCVEASNHQNLKYYFIIDEINRGNLSKIFGELLMLIENDHREEEITLSYSSLPQFSVPKNVYIIGLMNTADRSLAMIDYALRRRFSFIDIEPGFDSKGFKKYQSKLNNQKFNILVEKVKELNDEITSDKSLGKGFCIGHSYFCGIDNCTDDCLKNIVEFDILPMLREYWFDDDNKYEKWKKSFEYILKGKN